MMMNDEGWSQGGQHHSAAEDSVLSVAFSPNHDSGPLRAVHLSRHKWPGGLVN